eukprot:TRINITY_DN144_c0_g3_i1.p1 TRINITY_DN144_c0_g3~~TRINITY_DN144_c0_g3_i1.p1  ORF type:complete len:4665 (-),score=723.90 TRINITY_DN144_c0_g3_i1:29991-43985(-)
MKKESKVEELLLEKIRAFFSKTRDKVKKGFDDGRQVFLLLIHRKFLDPFLREKDLNFLTITGGGEGIQVVGGVPTPSAIGRKAIIIVKVHKIATITEDNFNKELAFIEIYKNPLECLSNVAQEGFFPILSNQDNQANWSELVSKDLMEKLNAFLSQLYVVIGQVVGKTQLPLPAQDETLKVMNNKERAHILETAIITWQKQIKYVLNQDPESLLKQGQDPNPLKELEFWRNRADNLNHIIKQINSDRVLKYLKELERAKSAYSKNFNELKKEVTKAAKEANSNYTYLQTLAGLFEELVGDSVDFPKLPELFQPIMHIVHLIWEHSTHYNTTPRLVVLIREICNAIISKSKKFVDGSMVFAMVTSGENEEAHSKLLVTYEVCTKFKSAYYEYKSKAKTPWTVTTNAVFYRLDSFMDRCQDLMQFISTIIQFTKFSKVELGGTKGEALLASRKQIDDEFKNVVEDFKKVTFDILDTNVKEFDEEFLKFRTRVKELERRVTAILNQSFEDLDTIISKLKLLESFEGLLSKQIIHDELEKKYIVLLEMFKGDLVKVQTLFLNGKKLIEEMDPQSPLPVGMPPVAGALNWSRGLEERIREPMEKLSNVGHSIQEREEYKDVHKLYTSIMKGLKEFEALKIKQWESTVDANSEAKLLLSVLKENPDGNTITVNFDQALVELLREVKYLLLLDKDVPEKAKQVFAKADTYRQQTCQLEGIVAIFNEIVTTLHPVQYPLFKKRIMSTREQLAEGFDKYQWVTEKLNDFINVSKHEVNELNKLVLHMKNDEGKIKNTMAKWNKPMMERKNKPQHPYDVYDAFNTIFDSDIKGRMKETAKDISATISSLGDALKVDKASPEWKEYESYINCMVITEISESVKKSLEFMKMVTSQQKGELIFEIDLLLDEEGRELMFNPPLLETKMPKDGGKLDPRDKSVRDVIFTLIGVFMQFAAYFTRLDDKKTGDFLKEITDDFEIAELVTCISNNIFNIESAVTSYSKEFSEFKFLWTENLDETFEKFLQSSAEKQDQTAEDEEEAEEIQRILNRTIFKGVAGSLPPLSLFDSEIARLTAVKSRIEEIKDYIDIHWIRVKSDGLRESLIKEIDKWIAKYSSFLHNDLTQKLSNMQQFTKDVEEGIKQIPKGTDTPEEKAQLDKVMNLLRDMKEVYKVSRRQNQNGQTMVDMLREAVQVLKKHGTNIEEQVIDQIENAKSALKDIHSKSSEAREQINPLQTKETENIKAEVKMFAKSVEEFLGEFKVKLPYSTTSVDMETVNRSYELIETYFDRIGKFEEAAKKLNGKEVLFGLQRTDFKKLKEYKNELKSLKYVWDMIAYVEGLFQDWKAMPWKEIKSTEDMMLELRTIREKVISQSNPKNKLIKTWGAFRDLEKRAADMDIVLAQVDKLHSECIKERHWKELMQIINQEIDVKSPNFCLEDLIKLKLYNYKDDVSELHALANREAQTEKLLGQIESFWDKAELKLEVKKGGEVPLLTKLDDIITKIEDDAQRLASQLAQRKYVKFFEERIERLQESNKIMNSVIERWIKVQRKWENLEPIFTKDDIRGPLPDATKKFESNSEAFKDIMKKTQENPKVIQACLFEGREEALEQMYEEMEDCNKSLKEYIESKRKIFPRFYFLSPEQITDILAHATDPTSVTRHISSCFEGIKTLHFVKPTEGDITVPKCCSAMESRHDPEVVDFHELFDCTGAVELWLKRLEEHMQKTVKSILRVAKPKADTWETSPDYTREDWIREFPSQIALLGSQIIWTEEVRNAIRNYSESGSESALKECLETVKTRIGKLIERVRELSLTRNFRSKIMIVITNDVHGRDIIEKLIVNRISDETSFAWQSQLKFDWKDPDCTISIAGWETTYGYEYVGNIIRLVITPLTDRCYITLTQALKLDMGAAPAGPAGTGKTETVKDLGRALGLMVQVYNCSEEMTKESMEMVYLGLIQSGCWGCFDEFNRIAVEVLSVIATQVDTMQKALKDYRKDKSKVKFDFTPGKTISLVPTVGIFITMNPGYAGRTELPDNLKALFRSCAMVVPDFALICENMLMSEGFKEANSLSRKFTQLYALNKDLLSKQVHYDWGMRAIKAVLRMSGKLKREEPNLDEDSLLMRALRDFNKPKIITTDWPIISRVIEDLFPNCKADPKKDPKLEAAVKEISKRDKLQDEDGFVLKCIQLAEILEVRHCCFIIGPAGSGKTEAWRVLANSMTHIGQETLCEVVNPKAFNSRELYGSYTKSGDWKDGVISSIMRRMSKNMEPYNRESIKHKWMILDGDVDPDWIESMNSVMDDSKILTLVSQDRIELTSSMHMLIEIGHLRTATPATVSRGGVLFVNETDIGFKPYWDTWLEGFKEEFNNDIARGVFYFAYNQYLSESNWEEIRSYNPVASIVPLSCVQNLCKLLREFYIEFKERKEKEKKLKEDYFEVLRKSSREDEAKAILESFFIYAMMWAIGGALTEDRRAFSQLIKRLSKIRFPETGSCFDYYFDPDKCEWVHWNTQVPQFVEPQEDELFQNIRVPTLETTRQGYILKCMMNQERAVLFVGPSGTAKTTQAKQFLSSLSKESYRFCTLNFNSYSDPASVQKIMHDQLGKRFGKKYGPPVNTHMIYFIDDVNMPKLDKYGYQGPIALLRQLIDHKQWYDRTNVDDKFTYEDLLFIGCMNQKAGSFHIDTRLQRHFAVMACSIPEKDVLEYITKKMTESYLSKFDSTVQGVCSKFAKQSVELFASIYNDPKFKPTAVKFHYTFNLRDLMKLIQAVANLRPQQYKGAPAQLVKFWIHENLRNFQDRMADPKDIEEIRNRVQSYARGFEADMNEAAAAPIIFTSFVSSLAGQDKSYMPLKDIATLKQVIGEVMERYNSGGNEAMNLVLFDQALEHICRITRIIDQPTGHALLIGVGGSGKQSLSRVASFILEYMPFTITLTSGYDMSKLKADLQSLYKMATIKPGKTQVLLLTDAQISQEEFLVYINDILANGYVPDLFNKQEMDQVVGALRNEAKSYGFTDTEVPGYFLSKSQRNIHIILCFSPKGPKFKQRAREFPGVISCTSMDWFHDWPKDALVDVGKSFLQKIDITPELRDSIAAHIAEVHISVEMENERFRREERRNNYTTPKIFLGLIDLYQSLLQKNQEEAQKRINNLDRGLTTMAATKTKVEGLQKELDVAKVEVAEEQKKTDVLVEDVSKKNAIAEEERKLAQEDEKVANEKRVEAEALSKEATEQLEKATPLVEKAQAAARNLSQKSIGDMKAFPQPPPGVKMAGECIYLLLKGKPPKEWNDIKNALNDPKRIIDQALKYDGTSIEESLVEKTKNAFKGDEAGFLANAKNGCMAAGDIAVWVVNMLKFNKVYKEIKPLMERKEAATATFESAKAAVEASQKRVATAEEQVNKLSAELDKCLASKKLLEDNATALENKQKLALRLINGLADENTRWANNIEELKERLVMLIGDTLLAASFISYIGAFSYEFRQRLWHDIWLEDMKAKGIPMSPNVDPLYNIVSEGDIAKWKNQKLPSDQVSYENAAILTSCTRWPLIIDPQRQGIEWLINKAEDSKTEMPRIQVPGTRNWNKEVARCIGNGHSLLIENAGEDFAPSLDPVLAKRYIQVGKRFVIKFDDEDIDVHPEFQLFIQTKLSNPHYRPEITAQCTIINFIVTEKGLEDQMLATVVDLENSELEARREATVKAQNENKWTLQLLEKTLLQNLSEADPETILENQKLVESLEITKSKATEIAKQQEESKKLEEEINKKRELYRRVAAEGSTLFFLLMQLSFVNRMYQYSLDSFYKFFKYAISHTKPCDDVEKRVVSLREKIRYQIYQWVRRGLFERHRQIFLTQITLRLMQKGVLKEPYKPKEVEFLLKAQPKTDGPKHPDWMQEKHWQLCVALTQIEGFENFATEVEKNGVRFKEWYNDLTPETTRLPSDWKNASIFHMLLILRCMRRDRITMGLRRLINDVLPNGTKFIAAETSFTTIMAKSYKMSSQHTPFFFILSPGSAPKKIVEDLVAAQNPKDFKSLSMGQGVDKDAEEYLARGHKEGIWVFLENCHLMPKWLPKLEQMLDSYALEGGHENFRLFLSGEPSDKIPIGLLERCIKLTCEPPQELKDNVQMAFKSFSQKEFEDKSEKYRCVLFALCFFHGLVVVRKRFGSTGWNGNYPFNLQDLRDSAKVMETYLEGSKVPWEDMKYIIGEIMYGGHITDDWDRKLCKAYLDFLMRDELFEEMDMIPYPPKNSNTSFKCVKLPSYESCFNHINGLPETPLTFGMNPNAELNYREEQADTLFSTLQDLQPKDAKGTGEEASAQQEKFKEIKDMVEKFDSQRIPSDMLRGDENRSPFQNVFMQESERMNSLISSILISMNDLELAMNGQLTMTEAMDRLQDCLIMYRVPEEWQKYETTRTLLPWLTNLSYRIEQLNNWKDNPAVAPKILYLNYLFNPQAFLTAIKQTEAQRSKVELNKLYIQTEITGKKPDTLEAGIDQSLKKAAVGVNVYGFFLEGCRIDPNSKFLDESEPKKLFVELPVVICRAAPVPPEGKEDKSLYICPVYKTKKRGPNTFVFTAQLKTKDPPQKWTLAGAAIILDVEDDLAKPFFGKQPQCTNQLTHLYMFVLYIHSIQYVYTHSIKSAFPPTCLHTVHYDMPANYDSDTVIQNMKEELPKQAACFSSCQKPTLYMRYLRSLQGPRFLPQLAPSN